MYCGYKIMNTDLHGILLVDKPSGCTSFDVVRRVRKMWDIKKIGHAGTLDPLATGLMVVLIGNYTKASDLLLMEDKSYEARITLGSATTTDDRMGEPIGQSDLSELTIFDIQAALDSFLGVQQQRPPNFSAIKIAGERCYKKARRGQTVTIQPRQVCFHDLKILKFEYPHVDISVKCSKGTYIRSLARDLGEAVGGHAHIGELRRTASGYFSIQNAIPLDDIRANHTSYEGVLAGPSVFQGIQNYPLSTDQVTQIKFGQRIDLSSSESHLESDCPTILYKGAEIIGLGVFRDKMIFPHRIWM